MIKRRINTQTEEERKERLEKIKGMEWGKSDEPPPKIDPRIASGADSYTIPNHGKPFRGAPKSATVSKQIADRKLNGTDINDDGAGTWGTKATKEKIETARKVIEENSQSDWEEFQEFKRMKEQAQAVKDTIPTILPNDPDLEPDIEPVKKYSSYVKKLINDGTLNESVAEALHESLGRTVNKADLPDGS